MSKFSKDKLSFTRITNNDLVCKDCTMRYDDTTITGNTSKCEFYDVKPNDILLGGPCDVYEGESL